MYVGFFSFFIYFPFICLQSFVRYRYSHTVESRIPHLSGCPIEIIWILIIFFYALQLYFSLLPQRYQIYIFTSFFYLNLFSSPQEYFSQSNWKVLLTLMINVAESAQQKLLADSNSNITTDTNDSNANEKIDSNSNITTDTNDANANEKRDSKVDSQSFADSNNKTSDSLNRTPSNAKKRSKSKKKQSKGAADSNEPVESVKSAQKSVKSAEKSELLEKNKSSDDVRLVADWKALLRRLKKLQVSSKKKGESQHAMAFSFIEGTLVKALREGMSLLIGS